MKFVDLGSPVITEDPGPTFMDYLLNGISVDINDFIDEWHTGKSGLQIWQYLGMTRYEYAKWVECGSSELNLIIRCRRQEQGNFIAGEDDENGLA